MQVNAKDRSFLYGDAIFSTMCVRDGGIELWPLHWQRLQHSMQRLGFAAIDQHDVEQQLRPWLSSEPRVVKIQVSRGFSQRGYSPSNINNPQLYISAAPMPDYQGQQQLGVQLELAQLRLGCQPLLAGVKHCSRLETVLLKQEAEQRGCEDLLVCDSTGYIVEATAANVFWLQDGVWYSPRLTQAGVAGVMRELLLQSMPVTLVDWTVSQLHAVQAMFLTNALMGVVPVNRFAQQVLELGPVSDIQQQLSNWKGAVSTLC